MGMETVFDYVKKYGGMTFREKGFNDIDNLVFSMIAYLDFSVTHIHNGHMPLSEVAREYFEAKKIRDIRKKGIGTLDGYKMFNAIKDLPRYKDVIVTDYEYKANIDMQFGAVAFQLTEDLAYIAFEGTDQRVSSWREDMELACSFPVPAHVLAVEFLNRNIKTMGPKVIVGGHSKGGNLALVACMYMSYFKRRRILRIYSNDGPGLRRKEFESKRYQNVRDKYVHFVPEKSYIGMMLLQDKYSTIKSSSNGALCHQLSTWEVLDDRLRRGQLSDSSKKLRANIHHWLQRHDDSERRKLERAIFGTLEKAGIMTTHELLNIPNIVKILKGIKDIDEESRSLVIDMVKSGFLGLDS